LGNVETFVGLMRFVNKSVVEALIDD